MNYKIIFLLCSFFGIGQTSLFPMNSFYRYINPITLRLAVFYDSAKEKLTYGFENVTKRTTVAANKAKDNAVSFLYNNKFDLVGAFGALTALYLKYGLDITGYGLKAAVLGFGFFYGKHAYNLYHLNKELNNVELGNLKEARFPLAFWKYNPVELPSKIYEALKNDLKSGQFIIKDVRGSILYIADDNALETIKEGIAGEKAVIESILKQLACYNSAVKFVYVEICELKGDDGNLSYNDMIFAAAKKVVENNGHCPIDYKKMIQDWEKHPDYSFRLSYKSSWNPLKWVIAPPPSAGSIFIRLFKGYVQLCHLEIIVNGQNESENKFKKALVDIISDLNTLELNTTNINNNTLQADWISKSVAIRGRIGELQSKNAQYSASFSESIAQIDNAIKFMLNANDQYQNNANAKNSVSIAKNNIHTILQQIKS